MSSFQNLKYKYNTLDAFGKIIVINGIIFIISLVCNALLRFDISKYFHLPYHFEDFIMQPWSIITYGFFHNGIWHVLFNMLFLFYLTRVATNLFRPKMVLNIYFLGIITGGFLFLVIANLIPLTFLNLSAPIVGASAGVSALLLFIGVYMPTSSIRPFNLFTVTWQQIAVFFICLDVLRLILNINPGGYLAHMGGYLLGFYYAKQLQKGNDIGKGFERLMDTVASWFQSQPKMKTVHRKAKNSKSATTPTSSTANYQASDKQKQIDAILDKISKSGYESLTKAEKEFLFNAGNDN